MALFTMDRQLIWAWSKDDVFFRAWFAFLCVPAFRCFRFVLGAYCWQVSLWEDGELLDMWDCLPELNIATPVFQHAKDSWNGILNIPSEFSIHHAEVDKVRSNGY